MDQPVEHFKRTFRENLERYRENEGYTQVELSEKSGFEKSYVGKLERGEADPSFGSIRKLCETLEVSPAELLLGKDTDSAAEPTATETRMKVQEVELEMQEDQLQNRREELAAQNERYRRFYRKAPLPFIIVNSRGLIIEANEQFVESFVPEGTHLDGEHINGFVHPEDRDDLYRYRNNLTEGKSPEPISLRFRETSGDSTLRRLESTLLKPDDGPEEIFLIIHEIQTPSRRAETKH